MRIRRLHCNIRAALGKQMDYHTVVHIPLSPAYCVFIDPSFKEAYQKAEKCKDQRQHSYATKLDKMTLDGKTGQRRTKLSGKE